jgi:hypothetical protein
MKTLLMILGSPIWISLLAVALALYVTVWAVIVSLWAVFAAMAIVTVAGIAVGIVWLFSSGLIGLATIGMALAALGLSIFAFLGCLSLTRGIVRLTKIPFN